ncbi:MAG: peptidylprolyl isomerase [Deltaproteobacteria bacterium]|nr:peptidylprolyl isomerase [Deltaproteobacteria bacterium]
MLRTIALAATMLSFACPSSRPARPTEPPPAQADDRELRIRVARAEARRAGGVAELIELAKSPDVHTRVLALRGLGRIDTSEAMSALMDALYDPNGDVQVAAVDAIGVAGSLDDPPYFSLFKPHAQISMWRGPVFKGHMQGGVLVQDNAHVLDAHDITTAGRIATPGAESDLVDALRAPELAESAAIALARMGRRKIAWTADVRAAVVAATRDKDPRVRYAATYALMREHEPPADESANAALRDRLKDDDAETRAQAIAGLTKRKAAKIDEVIGFLRDRDWRVAVEAVRAVAADPVGQRALAVLVAVAPDPVADEALRQLAAQQVDEYARTLLAKTEPTLSGWRQCFARAILRVPFADLHCDGIDLAILADIAKISPDVTWKRGAIRALLESTDARLKMAAFPLIEAPQLIAALASKDVAVAGAALDAIGDRFAGDAAVEAAIVQRAKTETDVELGTDLFTQIGQRKLAAGADACRGGLAGHPVRARAAADCLRQLGEAVPPPALAEATPPPVDVASVIGKHVLWHLETTRGGIDIELAPDDAPWNVATIVALTQKGFYDGLAFHRVVHDFVVQGGDPTQSGWGGPGFTTPAEPSAGARFVEGGVGIADAGRDSGGSQYFIMHSRAAHLDGRYTWIGHVISGQEVADELRVGDRVVKATVEVR